MKARDYERRLWGRTERTAGGCWLWTGSLRSDGYGQVRVEGKNTPTHRAAYALAKGQIPAGGWVLHSCHERRCINPEHLRVGTLAENVEDMLRAGRQAKGDRHGSRLHPERIRRGANHPFALRPYLRPRGERHGMAKLTAQQVLELRQAHERGVSRRRLAGMFNTTPSNVGLILRRKTWREAP